jgi:hypothetical protein
MAVWNANPSGRNEMRLPTGSLPGPKEEWAMNGFAIDF